MWFCSIIIETDIAILDWILNFIFTFSLSIWAFRAKTFTSSLLSAPSPSNIIIDMIIWRVSYLNRSSTLPSCFYTDTIDLLIWISINHFCKKLNLHHMLGARFYLNQKKGDNNLNASKIVRHLNLLDTSLGFKGTDLYLGSDKSYWNHRFVKSFDIAGRAKILEFLPHYLRHSRFYDIPIKFVWVTLYWNTI